MKRKAVAAVLTAVMVASMFTGCGSDNGSSSAKSASAASAASAANDTVDEDGKVNGIMYQEGLPLVDEGAYTFSIFCDDSSESGEFIMLDEFKKQTNVDVDLKIYPYETATERLNLDLNSGDYADVIGGWTLSDNAILTYGVNQATFSTLRRRSASFSAKFRRRTTVSVCRLFWICSPAQGCITGQPIVF